MVSKARNIADLLNANGKVTADDLDVGQIGGRRNLIINGGFDVWQRGTSFTSGYTADRWQLLGSINATQIAAETPYGKYGIRLPITDSKTGVAQYIEAVNCKHLANKTVTVSVTGKVSTGTIDAYLYYANAEDNFSTYTYVNGGAVIDSATTETGTISVTLPAQAVNGIMLYIYVNGLNATADVFEVQLELGSVATPFEHRSYGEELALCQRYYQDYASGYKKDIYHVGFVFNSSQLAVNSFQFPEMRTPPTVTYYNPSHISTTGYWGIYGATSGWGSTGYQPFASSIGTNAFSTQFSGVAGVSNGYSYICNGGLTLDAEL